MHGVIDRIEDGTAVILIEEENKEWKIRTESLPIGANEGTILQLDKSNEVYTIIGIDRDATNLASNKAQSLQRKLQSKKKRSKFRRG